MMMMIMMIDYGIDVDNINDNIYDDDDVDNNVMKTM